jgi:hypothetical protein
MTTEKKRTSDQSATDVAMEERRSPGYVSPVESDGEVLPNSPNGRPPLASWDYECAIAHHQVDGRTDFLVKPRPRWLKQDEIPLEAEAEYWHRYQLSHAPGTTESDLKKLEKRDKDEYAAPSGRFLRAASPTPTRSPAPAYGSLAEIMNESRPLSPM